MTIIHHGLDLKGPAGLGSGSADKTQGILTQPSQAQTQTQAAPISPTDEVEITPAAQQLAALEQRISSTPDLDANRVSSIRQALSDGSYQSDSGRIADGVLAAQRLDAQVSAGAGPGTQSNTIKAFAATAQLGSDSD